MSAAETSLTPSPFRRADALAWLETTPAIPVLIVGGGINGAGVLRELAINGIDALLVDKGDFTTGATCASSRMIHGGLRYLENGEFRLVREALRERNRLLRNAPHAVFPLETVIPLFRRFTGFGNAARKFLRLGGRPARRGLWVVRTGLAMYDWFARDSGGLPQARIRSREETLARHPALNPAAIGSACYFDAWNPAPERLCLEVLADALAHHDGCRALNYCAVTGTEHGGRVVLRDAPTGREFAVQPSVVINATGAWIDRVNQHLGIESRFIGGTRGAHLVLDHPGLLEQLDGSELFYENDDGRICLILPWYDRVLVGTTDIRTDDPDTAVCEADEFAYLIAAARQVFPAIEIRPEQVVARFSGVRPLPRVEGGPTGTISRDHACRETPASAGRPYPVFSLVGGKWTTFRAFAELVADRALAVLGKSRRASSTELPIGGGRDFPPTDDTRARMINDIASRTGLPRETCVRLFERYGTTAERLAAHIAGAGPAAREPVADYLAGELDYLARHEAVVHLDDLVLRRSHLALFGRLDEASLQKTASIVAAALGWSAETQEAEVARTVALLRERHGIHLEPRN